MTHIDRAHDVPFARQRARDVRITFSRCRTFMHERHTRPLRSIAEVLVMFVSRVCAVVLSSLVAWPALVPAEQESQQARQQACSTDVPSNIRAGIVTSEMIALLRVSDTFRAQCQRIAADPRVQVRLDIVPAV